MNPPRRNLTSSQAAAYLGVSAKALRIYERQGLIVPGRSAAGWRLYGPDDLARASEILCLRRLGLSLAQIVRVLDGDRSALESGLAVQEERLCRQAEQIDAAFRRVRGLRDDLRRGQAPDAAALDLALGDGEEISVGFELPWPWGGEWFELRAIPPLNFITGPLGSGKTRFAERLAAALPDAAFLGLDRLRDPTIGKRLDDDAALAARVDGALDWLEEEGAVRTEALFALVVALEADAPTMLVIDTVEDGLCDATQRAVIAYLRVRMRHRLTLFLMTRSSSILDLHLVGVGEAVVYCPANHSPPFRAELRPGGHGYEAVATCLATPAIRARTAGIVAIRSDAAA